MNLSYENRVNTLGCVGRDDREARFVNSVTKSGCQKMPLSLRAYRRNVAWMLAFVVIVAGFGIGRSDAQMMLYDDRLPDGYAYIRFANVTSEVVSVKPDGFGDPLTLGNSGEDRISSYYVVEGVSGRELAIQAQGKRLGFKLMPGLFHTLLIEGKGSDLSPKIVTDQTELNQTKARLSFYNAVPSCPVASLLLEPKGQTVLTDVGPNFMRGRAINPSRNPRVRANCGTASVAELELGPLDAGGQYSLWLISSGDRPTAFLSRNKIAPYLR